MFQEAPTEKARRRADRALVATYHQAELTRLLAHVRTGFARYDAGEIDVFELDDLIYQYKRATIELWKFCGATGSEVSLAARAIDSRTREGQAIDWWHEGALRRPRK